MEKETNQFIEDLRQGKPAAQQRLLTVYGPAVFRLVMRMVGQREDAEEVYQDVFVKALTKISTYDPRKASLATWLGRIAYNESANHIRQSKLNYVLLEDNELKAAYEEVPVDQQHNEQDILFLEQAITLLPATDQTLLSLFYKENMSLQDIAYVTGSIPTTVGSRLSRIRKKLYHLIKQITEK